MTEFAFAERDPNPRAIRANYAEYLVSRGLLTRRARYILCDLKHFHAADHKHALELFAAARYSDLNEFCASVKEKDDGHEYHER